MPKTLKDRDITIGGKEYRLRFRRTMFTRNGVLSGYRGRCTPPAETNRTITIHSGLRGVELLETILHELWHGADWQRDEEFVDSSSSEMAKILWDLGYRLPGVDRDNTS